MSDCQILKTPQFSRHIFDKDSNFMKIRPMGAEIFPCGRTDMTKLIVAFVVVVVVVAILLTRLIND